MCSLTNVLVVFRDISQPYNINLMKNRLFFVIIPLLTRCFLSLSLPPDEPGSCAECEALVGGLFDDQASSGTVRRSLSAPYPHSLDPSLTSEAQSKYHCDLVARNGSDVYRYPSPLHAVAVQSPIFFQTMSGGHGKDEGHGECFIEGQKLDPTPPPPPPSAPPVSAPLVPQSTSWPAPFSSSSSSSSASSNFTPSHKRLENYIYSLLQRRALPIRTNKPRTSINTDPSKSILRQASLCVRQGPGLGHGTLRGSELKTNWQTCVPPGGVGNFESTGTSSPRRQWSVESKGEEQENGGIGHLQGQTQNGFSINNSDMAQNGYPINNTDSAQNLNGYSMSNSGVQHGYLIHNVVQNGYSMNNDIYMNTNTNSLLKKKGLSSASKGLLPPSTTYTTTLPKDYKDLGSPNANSSPKETKQPCYPVTATIDQELPVKSPQIIKTQSATPKQSPKPLPHVQSGKGDRSVPELISLGSSSQSQDEGGGSGGGGSRLVSAHYIPAQRQAVRLRKGGGKSIKIVKVKSTASIKASRASAHAEPVSDTVVVRGGDKQQQSLRSGSKKSGLPEEASSTHHKVSKRGVGGASGVSSSKIKRIPVSIPEGRVLDKQATSTVTSVSTGRSGVSRQHHGHHGNHHHNGSSHHGHHHHHGRDSVVVVAKPKHKRNDYRRLRAITEVPYEEAFRRAQRRQRRELLSQTAANVYLPASGQYTSPYAYVAGSDSEYSAECASLFHSTIMDTSEDEKSNYTTNCFGDSESSVSEVDFVGESSTTTDSEESGGGGAGGGTGGAGRGWTQAGGQQMTPAQAKAFVKIKASHNLKKRILRFRSGSLKLMTTV